MKHKFYKANKQKGVSLVESIISSGLILFVLSSSFLIINSSITTSVITEKKTQLIQQLDKKIADYILTGRFNDQTIGDDYFSQKKVNDSKMIKFVAKNKDFNICVSKEIMKYGANS
ncbi:type II secretion system protein [Francisella philomiragia]